MLYKGYVREKPGRCGSRYSLSLKVPFIGGNYTGVQCAKGTCGKPGRYGSRYSLSLKVPFIGGNYTGVEGACGKTREVWK